MPTGPLRILVVDDQPMVARALSRMLHGHVVHIADGLGTAYQLVKQETYDVVIADHNLRDGCGVDLLRAAHAQVSVVISGAPPDERYDDDLASGQFHWVNKPFRRKTIDALVAQAARQESAA